MRSEVSIFLRLFFVSVTFYISATSILKIQETTLHNFTIFYKKLNITTFFENAIDTSEIRCY